MLDPRIAYVMTNMMEGVINNGLGYTAVRLRGFTPPAAGKTGSSHDGWFAGYTSNLLCVVWVGYDDYSDLRLSGAHDGGADLDGVHEEGVGLAAVFRHEVRSRSRPEWWMCNSISPRTGWRRRRARMTIRRRL